MTADERLAAIRTDLRYHRPYRSAFMEQDVCPICSGFYDLGPVPWPCAPVRMADALDAVLALHTGPNPHISAGVDRGAFLLGWEDAMESVEAAITDALGEP